MDKEQSDETEMIISLSNYLRQETKTSLHFSLDTISFSITEFEITDSFVLQKLMFALQCLFCNSGALASLKI